MKGEKMNTETTNEYPLRLEVDYPEKLDRMTTFFRLLWIIPIAIILGLVSGAGETVTNNVFVNDAGEIIRTSQETAGGLLAGLASATGLMILFTKTYPKWWFDFVKELTRFETRVGAYAGLMTDVYPSVVEEQAVHLDIDYPDVEKDLNRWMPIFKWFLAIPHYIVLAFLSIGAFFAMIFAWFAIMFTGTYPRGLFDYNVGVSRWWLRVAAYTTLLVTDQYPPFSLQ
jgi:hypothetical protein